MKRSEYIAQRRAYWQSTYTHVEPKVQEDVRAAEAADVVWDKEDDLQLPKSVRFAANGDRALAFLLDSGLIIAETVDGQVMNSLRIATLRAMVDAYNDWGPHGRRRKELWKLIDADLDEHKLRRFVGNVLTMPWGEEESR